LPSNRSSDMYSTKMWDRACRLKLHKTDREVERSLAFVLRNAAAAVPFWSERLKGAVDGGRIALSDLPITTREDLLEAELAARTHRRADLRRCIRTSTSGFSGVPLTILLSRPEAAFRKLMVFHTLRRYAPLRLPLRIADIGPMVPHDRRPLEQRLGAVQIHRLPGDMSVAQQAAALRSCQPNLIEGYPTCLELLAETLRETQEDSFRPRLVVCRGEALHDRVRALLTEIFRAPIADLYSCEEAGNIAWECPQTPGRYHINRDACLVEIVDDNDRPVHGTEGRILVTTLYSRTTPFIRLELGDRGRLIGSSGDRCVCGQRGPFLVHLMGKDDDEVVLADGRRISPRVLTNAVFNALRSPHRVHELSAAVRRYQVAQKAPDLVEVRIVWNEGPDATIAARIAEEIAETGAGLRCVCRSVGALELLSSGKFKKVIRTFPTDGRAQSD